MKRLRNYVTTKVFYAAILVLCCGLYSSATFAGIGTSLMQGADIAPLGQYEARFQSDFITNNGGGVNLSGHFRTGLVQDFFDIGAYVGTGKTDFQAGFNTKFNLLPDLPGQVGLSFMGGISVIQDDIGGKDDSFFAFHTSIITSKNFVTSFGDVDPYVAFQVEGVFLEGENIYPLTLVTGVEWKLQATDPFHLFTEVDFDIDDSLTMFSVGGSYHF